MDESLEVRDLPADVVDLAELLAEKLELGAGETRLEAVFDEGTLRYVFRHDRHDRNQLRRRFPPSAPSV
jgi:hypothetical protein